MIAMATSVETSPVAMSADVLASIVFNGAVIPAIAGIREVNARSMFRMSATRRVIPKTCRLGSCVSLRRAVGIESPEYSRPTFPEVYEAVPAWVVVGWGAVCSLVPGVERWVK